MVLWIAKHEEDRYHVCTDVTVTKTIDHADKPDILFSSGFTILPPRRQKNGARRYTWTLSPTVLQFTQPTKCPGE